MKQLATLLLLLLLMAWAGSSAAEKPQSLGVKSKNLSLSVYPQSSQVDGKTLPFLEAVAAGKEKFGVELGGVPATSSILEIVDGHGKVVRSLSVNDILGRGVSKETQLLPSAHARRAETVYTVRILEQDARIIVRSLATGDEGSAEQRLLMTLLLKTESPLDGLALQWKLPVNGTPAETPGGFLILSRSGNAAIVGSVFPNEARVSAQKGRLTLVSTTRSLRPAVETPMLWFVLTGVTGTSPAQVRSDAAALAMANHPESGQPRVLVVTAADKERLTQADTASYAVICTNIGTGEATDVVLSNPIPRGARYVPGSATTSGMELREEGANTGVTGLKWIARKPLLPGEERIVAFRVTVR